MRLAMGVEYDGSSFHGWQRQKSGVATVQELVEKALSSVADHPVSVLCAGRTDTGVHGLGQVIHFDTAAVRSYRGWLLGTNVNLPSEINVTWVKEVAESFHARFSALNRRYRYIILNRSVRSAIWCKRTVWIHYPLDAERMHEAAQVLVGTHDFSSYRALGCQAKSPVKSIIHLNVSRQEDRVIIDIKANAFLHHMVRNLAGVLIAIGKGDRPLSWAEEVLGYRDRRLAGVTAPPEGLYLMEVGYPLEFGLTQKIV